MRLAAIFLMAILSLSGQAQPTAPETRAIYEKDAKEQVRLALEKKSPNTLLTRSAVPSEKIAVTIHQAVASSVFGDEHIRKQQPFFAVRSGEFWVIYGSVPGGGLGGSAVSVIRASNGEVLSVVHQQ